MPKTLYYITLITILAALSAPAYGHNLENQKHGPGKHSHESRESTSVIKSEENTETEHVKAALVQTSIKWGNVSANLRHFGRMTKQCRKAGADIIVFPELFTSGCEMKKNNSADKNAAKDKTAAEYGRIVKKMLKWANQSDALIIGSTIYKENGKYYNRLIAAYPDNRYETYDKHNCFKKGSFSPGNSRLILQWKGMRLATFICYDLRFPEWSRNENDYDIAIYIANWPESRHSDWERLLKERAMENKAFIIAVNCCGTDLAGIKYKGGSRLLEPSGKTAALSTDYREEITICDIPAHL